MNRVHPIEVLLGLLILIGIGLHFAIGADYSKRNFEFMPNMAENPGYEAQDPNPNFADGRTLRPPVPGTVARGHKPLMHDGVLLDIETTTWKKVSPEQQAAWNALAPHYAFDTLSKEDQSRALARGKAIYDSVCATCHGLAGDGQTPVTQRGMPPPPTLISDEMRALSDGRVFRTITVGQGNMASHANQVRRDERWLVIHYLRSLQQAKQ